MGRVYLYLSFTLPPFRLADVLMCRGDEHQDETGWIVLGVEDHGALVQHRAEHPMPHSGPYLIIKRAGWLLNRDDRAETVSVVPGGHLQMVLGWKLNPNNTLTMMLSVLRRLVSKYLIREMTGLMVVWLMNSLPPLGEDR
jgi:hypothetical protein